MSNQRAEMKVGGISATMTDHGVRGDFHAATVTDVRHFPKREKGPGPKDRGCHEFNILEFEGSEGTTFSLYMDTDQLANLIEKTQAALDGREE